MCILAQQLRIPKIQSTAHMKLKKKRYHEWMLLSLEGRTKYSQKYIQGQSVEQRLKERPSGLPHLGIYPIQSPNPDNIVDAKKCMLTGA